MVRFGVVGYGGRAHSLINNVFRDVEPGMKIVGIVDPDEKKVRSRLADADKADVVFYKNLDELVRKGKLDALMIGTRCNLHTPMAIKAAKYDIPLYLEKPVAVSMRQAVALERAFEKSKCEVVVSFPLRVSPLCVRAKEIIDGGALGSCEHVSAVNYVNYGTVYWDEGYRDYDVTQGLFLQKAVHDLDYISYLMGSPIVRVGAMMTAGRVFGGKKKAGLWCSKCRESDRCLESPKNRKINGSGGILEDHMCTFGRDCGNTETGTNEDSSSCVFEFASGVHGIYTQVFFCRRDSGRRGATVSGYDGTLSFDWYENEMKMVYHHRPFTDVTTAAEGMAHFGGDTMLAYNFFDILRGKAKSKATIFDGLQSVYACLAAKESALKGKFVNVRQVGTVI